MDVEDAIRERRTLKSYEQDPVDDAVVRELLELAVLAPNHHETEPWRFWVVGRDTIAKLSKETGDVKLLRSPTAIVAGLKRSDDPGEAEEDYAAVACALQNIMLAARGRGLASMWRTPGVMDKKSFRKVLGVPSNVRIVGVVHVGRPADPFPDAPTRDAERFTTWMS